MFLELAAINGSGTGEMLDHLAKQLYYEKEDKNNEKPRIAIVGKPNVGKSSLTNALLDEDRNIVTDISGTTKMRLIPILRPLVFDLILVDTAGIRKKSKVYEDIEFYSVMRAIRAIEDSDVCLFMIDAKEGLQKQDLSIFSVVEKDKKGIVLLVNKWDSIEKGN